MKEVKEKLEKMEKDVKNNLSNNIYEGPLLAALYSDVELLKMKYVKKKHDH